MLSVYTNQQELLKASATARASRIESVDSELLKLDSDYFSVTVDEGKQFPTLEVHVYTPDGLYLTGNHDTYHYSIEKSETSSNLVTHQHLAINIPKTFEELGLSRGQYRVVYNLFDNVLGSYKGLKLWIKEISPSRRELRLQLSENGSPTLLKQLDRFQDRWNLLSKDDQFDSFILNFGFNETYQIINVRFETEFTETPEILVKLYNPLPAKYGEKVKLWISEELIAPVLDNVVLVPKFIPEPVNKLRAANFEIEEFDASSVATDFKTWNDLLSTNLQTSQQLIDNQFSGSLSGIKLNINYRVLDNFVHYGSAVERIKNFKYKLQLIEQFTDRLDFLFKTSDATIVQSNLNDLYTKRNRIVSSFDDFEKYLFFESSGSNLYTHYDEVTGSNTIQPVLPWPKITPTSLTWSEAYYTWSSFTPTWIQGRPEVFDYFANLAKTDSIEGEAYYNNLLEIAATYDKINIHKLQSTIPYHIQANENNEEFLLFIHMLGQHFDILWTYINHLTKIHLREEHPKDGMPDELLYHVASSLGFELLNGRSTAELWRYNLGTDAYGDVIKNNQGLKTLSDKQITREVWRRIVNNLPYILKTKGSSRSIKAMLNCFGIPLTVLTIKEYGGPSTFTNEDHYPEYIHDVFHYAWFSNANTGSLSLNIGQYTNGEYQTVAPNTLTFRFKTDNNFNYEQNSYYNLLSISSASISDVYNLILSKESADDEEGTLTLFNRVTGTAISASNLEIFDNNWNLVSIESTNLTSSFKLTKSLYGKTIYIKSASFYGESIFPDTGTVNLTIASGSRVFASTATLNGNPLTNMAKFYGHYQEVRIWSGTLYDHILKEHAASPNTYTYNRDLDALTTGEESAKPYEHLFQRFTLSTKDVLSGSFYIKSCHPNQKVNTGSLYFIGFENSSSIAFEGFEETYYTPSPSLGGSSLYTNKIRIESSSLDPNRRLNTKTRIEKSSYDLFSIDSNRVGVYFSPQTAINEDIFNQIGYFEIDDYIGDPGSEYDSHYPLYDNFAVNYWKKYENRNDFEAYFRALEIYDFTVFKYIKRLLPERVNPIVGLLVENNVLNRSKVSFLRNKPGIQELSKQAYLSADVYRPFAEYKNVQGLIDQEVIVPTAITKPMAGLIDQEVIVPTAVTKPISGLIDQEIITPTAITKPMSGLIDQEIIVPVAETKNLKGNINEEIIKPIAETKNLKGNIDEEVLITSGETKNIDGILKGIGSVMIANGDVAKELTGTPEIASPDVISDVNSIKSEAVFDMEITNASGEHASVLNLVFEPPQEWKYPIGTVHKQMLGDIQQKVATAAGDIQSIDRGDILGAINTDRLGTSWLEKKITGRYIYTQSGSFNPIGKQVYNSRKSTYKMTQVVFYSSDVSASLKMPSSSSLVFAEVNTEHGQGYENARFAGSKLTGPGINIDTPNTVDGGPVVKVTQVNPNQIVFANNQITTIDETRTGNRKKTI